MPRLITGRWSLKSGRRTNGEGKRDEALFDKERTRSDDEHDQNRNSTRQGGLSNEGSRVSSDTDCALGFLSGTGMPMRDKTVRRQQRQQQTQPNDLL